MINSGKWYALPEEKYHKQLIRHKKQLQCFSTWGEDVTKRKPFSIVFSSLSCWFTTVGFLFLGAGDRSLNPDWLFSLFSINHTRIFTLGCSYSRRQDYSEHWVSGSSRRSQLDWQVEVSCVSIATTVFGPINHVPMATLWPVHQFPSYLIFKCCCWMSFYNALNNLVMWKRGRII